jgi:hypothetical protein
MESPGIVVNRLITKLAKLSEQDVLQRVASVEQIRTRSVTVSLFISSTKRLKQLKELHAAVRSAQFTAGLAGFDMSSSWVPFLLELPAPLYAWLNANSWDDIEAQVLNWMAVLYAANCRRDDMLTKLKPAIKQLALAHYSPFDPRRAEDLVAQWATEYDNTRQQLTSPGRTDVLRNPFAGTEWPFLEDAAVLTSFRFKVRVGYFTEEDWLFIVDRNKQKVHKRFPDWSAWKVASELKRAETDTMDYTLAEPAMWQAWLRNFTPTESLLAR